MDGDEDQDILAVSSDSNAVLWFENNGAEGFTCHIVDDSFPRAMWVESADFDGDNDRDIIAASSEARAMAWWENEGGGKFTRHVIEALFEFMWGGTAVADLDNDGDTDVAAGSYSGLRWWENDGKGHFLRHPLEPEAKLQFLTTGDIDGDGWQDMVLVADGGVRWRKNLKGAQFSETMGAGAGDRSVAVTDIDGDGDGDIVVSGFRIKILENIGPDQWGYWQFKEREICPSFEDATIPWAVDFDGNGDIDIVCGSGTFGLKRISWWENKGQWIFAEHTIADNVADVEFIHPVDRGNTRNVDLVSVPWRRPYISYWLRNPQADPQPPGDVTNLNARTPAHEQRIELTWFDPPDNDLNRILLLRSTEEVTARPQAGTIYSDGDSTGPSGLWCRNVDRGLGSYLDLGVQPERTYYYKAFAYDNAANYSPGIQILCKSGKDITPPLPASYLWVEESDTPGTFYVSWVPAVDRGLAGFLLVCSDTDSFVPPANGTAYQNGEGSGPGGSWCCNYDVWEWPPPAIMSAGTPILSPDRTSYLAVYALDKYYNYSEGVYDSTAGGPFPAHLIDRIDDFKFGPGGIVALDFDKDGDGDLLTTAPGTERGIFLWENKGTGEFVRSWVWDPADTILTACDMDSDGDMDILYADRYSYVEIAWIENDHGLCFSGKHEVDLSFKASALAAGDFDGDGDVDVIATSFSPESMTLWKNSGGGIFVRTTLYEGVVASSMKTADADLDGDIDVLALGDKGLVWWVNDGNARFSVASVDDQYIGVSFIDVGDMDRDGDIDIVTARPDGQVAWWENNGALRFTRHDLATFPEMVVWPSLADLDGDGFTDILCATRSRLVWLRNDGTQNFSASLLTRHAIRGSSVPCSDLDHDGDLDVVGYLGQGVGIFWWENNLPLDEIPPSAVADFQAEVSDHGSVVLTWQPPGDADLKGILLVRNAVNSFPTLERLTSYPDGNNTGPGGLWCRTIPALVRSYEDFDVEAETRYFYAAYACDEVLNYSLGSFANIITGGDLTPPAAPSGLKATTVFNEVVLTWSDPGDADLEGILILRNVSDAFPVVPAGEKFPDGDSSGPGGLWCRNVPKGQQMYVDSTALSEVACWYAVYSYDEVPNYSEPAIEGIVPVLLDSDGDGLPDEWEKDHFGSLEQGASGDFDNDSRSNLSEFLGGSDPADPQSGPGFAESPWPAPGGNARRTGSSPYTGVSTDAFAWTYCPDKASCKGTAVIGPDGTIYVGALYWTEASLSVLSALTQEGELKWKYEFSGQLERPPSVGKDGIVYLGVWTWVGTEVHAVNPDGSRRWRSALVSDVMSSSPAIACDGTVYSMVSSRVVALRPDGALKWTFLYQGFAEGELAIGSDGTIYFGTQDGFFYAVDPDGSQKWRFPADGEIRHSAAVGLDDTIYFGTQTGRFYAMSPDGSPLWVVEQGLEITSPPAIGPDGTIFYLSGENLFARRNDGYLKWKYACSSSYTSLPVVDREGRVFLSSSWDTIVISSDGALERRLRLPGGRGVAIGGDGSLFLVGDIFVAALNRTDSDGDALPDSWERDHFGNLSQNAGSDPDKDFMTNLDEYRAKTDPLTPDYQRWVEMLRIPGMESQCPAVTTDAKGNPIVAFVRREDFNRAAYVMKWNGEEWEYVSKNPSDPDGIAIHGTATNPSLTTDGAGNPILAWEEEVSVGTRARNIFVKKWNGEEWTAIGDSAGTYGISGSEEEDCTDPVVVADLFGKPTVAWRREPSSGYQYSVQVKRWTGNEWSDIGGGTVPGYVGPYGKRNYALAVDYRGNPLLVWADYWSKAVLLKRWDGQTWQQIGSTVSGIGTELESSICPRVAVSPSGLPAVAWRQKMEPGSVEKWEAYMRMWNGSTWAPLGNSSSGNGVSNTDRVGNVMLGFGPSGQPFVVWLCERVVMATERVKLYARAWDGANWVDMGEGSSSSLGVGTPGNVRDATNTYTPELATNAFGEAFLIYAEGQWVEGWDSIVLRKFGISPDEKIRVVTPGGFLKGDITVRFVLRNSLWKRMDATVEFTLDGGRTWSGATPGQGGEDLVALPSSPEGIEHVFVWDSASNLNQNVRNLVILRVSATDGTVIARGTTRSFHVGAVADQDNDLLDDEWEMSCFGTLAYDRKSDPDFDRCPNIMEQTLGSDPTDPRDPQAPPLVTVATPAGTQKGNTTIGYKLVDYNGDRGSVEVHYSEDGVNWFPATAADGSEGTSGLTTSRRGIEHTFLWNSVADLRHTSQPAVRIRITPFDTERGTPGITGAFSVDNSLPDVETRLIYAAADADVRAVSPDSNFGGAELGVGDLPGGDRRTYLWFDVASLPPGHASGCELRMDVRSALVFAAGRKEAIRIWNVTGAWEEASITWTQQPAIAPTVVAETPLPDMRFLPPTIGPVTLSWRSEALDALVNSWLNGLSNTGLVVELDMGGEERSGELVFYSTESAPRSGNACAPRLIFDLEPYPEGTRPAVFVSPTGAPVTQPLYDNDELRVEVLAFHLEVNDAQPVVVESLSFWLGGTTAPEEDLVSMSLFVDTNGNGLYDGALVDTFLGTASSISSSEVAFDTLSGPIEPGSSADWLLVADFAGNATKGEYLTVGLAGPENLVCRGQNSGAAAIAIVQPGIEQTSKIETTSFRKGEFLVDDYRSGSWHLLRGSLDERLEEFVQVPETNINIEPVGIRENSVGDIYIAMSPKIYKFWRQSASISEVYRLPDGLSGMAVFLIDLDDNIYFSANDNELYRVREGEKEVRVSGGGIGFDDITALAVNKQNDVFVADSWSRQDFSSNIFRLTSAGVLSFYVQNLDEQLGGQYYVKSMCADDVGRLYILVWEYEGACSQRIYRVEEDPAHPNDPGHMMFTLLMSEPTQATYLQCIALQQNADGATADLYARVLGVFGQANWTLHVNNVTSAALPVTLGTFEFHGGRLLFPRPFCRGKDSDGDGIPDRFEDFNGNGIIEPELFETSPHDNSDASLDLDGDGMTNLQEYIAGTDPTLSASKFKVPSILWGQLSGILVSWKSAVGRTYQVFYSDDLAAPDLAWMACRDPIAGTGLTMSFTDVGDAAGERPHPLHPEVRQRYYRVLVDY
jgi:hypothetical protein